MKSNSLNPFMPLSSIAVVKSTIENLMYKFEQQLYHKKLDLRIPQHSYQYMTDTIGKMFDIFGAHPNLKSEIIVSYEEQQCPSLGHDNLMPLALNMQPPVNVPKPQSKNLSISVRQDSVNRKKSNTINILAEGEMSKRRQKKIQQNPFKQLEIELVEQEDRIVKLLRDKKNQSQKQGKVPIPAKAEKFNRKDKQKYNSITYDFNGQVIKVKNNEPVNLIRNTLDAVINQQLTNVQKSVVTSVKNPMLSSNGNNLKKVGAKQEQMQNAIITLQQIPVERFELALGAKISTNTRTNQNNKKQLTAKDLQENYKDLRLTKQDYFRLKQLQQSSDQSFNNITIESKPDKKIIVPKPSLQKLKHYKSISHLAQTVNIKNNQKITVNNEELKGIHLNRYEQLDNINLKTLAQTERIDKQPTVPDYQLQFLLKKSGTNPTLQRPKITGMLPEIKRLKTSSLALKARQKVKNQKQILIQIHKKFEDRLRTSSNIVKRN